MKNGIKGRGVALVSSFGQVALSEQTAEVVEATLGKWFGISLADRASLVRPLSREKGERKTLAVFVNEVDTGNSYMLLHYWRGMEGKMVVSVFSDEVANCPFLVAARAVRPERPQAVYLSAWEDGTQDLRR